MTTAMLPVTELQRLIEVTRTQLQAQCDQDNRYASLPLSPDTMRDSTGRFILLDAQVALVQALIALRPVGTQPSTKAPKSEHCYNCPEPGHCPD